MKTTDKHELLLFGETVRKAIAQGWIQGNLARDHDGDVIDAASAYATQFCLSGSVARGICRLPFRIQIGLEFERRMAQRIYPGRVGGWSQCLVQWNDVPGRTQEDVLALIDATLADIAAEMTN